MLNFNCNPSIINSFKILELKYDPNICVGDIKKAYKKMALLYHPDRTGEENGEKFNEIHQAYVTLLEYINSKNDDNYTKNSAEKEADIDLHEIFDKYIGSLMNIVMNEIGEILHSNKPKINRKMHPNSKWYDDLPGGGSQFFTEIYYSDSTTDDNVDNVNNVGITDDCDNKVKVTTSKIEEISGDLSGDLSISELYSKFNVKFDPPKNKKLLIETNTTSLEKNKIISNFMNDNTKIQINNNIFLVNLKINKKLKPIKKSVLYFMEVSNSNFINCDVKFIGIKCKCAELTLGIQLNFNRTKICKCSNYFCPIELALVSEKEHNHPNFGDIFIVIYIFNTNSKEKQCYTGVASSGISSDISSTASDKITDID